MCALRYLKAVRGEILVFCFVLFSQDVALITGMGRAVKEGILGYSGIAGIAVRKDSGGWKEEAG